MLRIMHKKSFWRGNPPSTKLWNEGIKLFLAVVEETGPGSVNSLSLKPTPALFRGAAEPAATHISIYYCSLLLEYVLYYKVQNKIVFIFVSVSFANKGV